MSDAAINALEAEAVVVEEAAELLADLLQAQVLVARGDRDLDLDPLGELRATAARLVDRAVLGAPTLHPELEELLLASLGQRLDLLLAAPLLVHGWSDAAGAAALGCSGARTPGEVMRGGSPRPPWS